MQLLGVLDAFGLCSILFPFTVVHCLFYASSVVKTGMRFMCIYMVKLPNLTFFFSLSPIRYHTEPQSKSAVLPKMEKLTPWVAFSLPIDEVWKWPILHFSVADPWASQAWFGASEIDLVQAERWQKRSKGCLGRNSTAACHFDEHCPIDCVYRFS